MDILIGLSCHGIFVDVIYLKLLILLVNGYRGENGGYRNLHNGELHSFYSSPNIARMIKSTRLR